MNRASRSCPIPPSAIPAAQWLDDIRGAVAILDGRVIPASNMKAKWRPDAALNPKVMASYPFSRLSGPAQRADHARPAIGQHLGQVAARTLLATR